MQHPVYTQHQLDAAKEAGKILGLDCYTPVIAECCAIHPSYPGGDDHIWQLDHSMTVDELAEDYVVYIRALSKDTWEDAQANYRDFDMITSPAYHLLSAI